MKKMCLILDFLKGCKNQRSFPEIDWAVEHDLDCEEVNNENAEDNTNTIVEQSPTSFAHTILPISGMNWNNCHFCVMTENCPLPCFS